MTYRSYFNGRPHNWKPRERPKVAATKVPCSEGCGRYIAVRKKSPRCYTCDEQRRLRSKVEIAEKLAAMQRAADLQLLPRDVTYNGIDYVLIWSGRGPLPGSSETPANLGASLMNTSRILP